MWGLGSNDKWGYKGWESILPSPISTKVEIPSIHAGASVVTPLIPVTVDKIRGWLVLIIYRYTIYVIRSGGRELGGGACAADGPNNNAI